VAREITRASTHSHPRQNRTLAAADDVRAQLRGVASPVDPRGGGAGPPGGSPARAGRVPAAGGHLVPRVHGGAAAEHPRVASPHGAAGGDQELGHGGGRGGHTVGGAQALRAGHERVALRALRRDPARAQALPRLPEGVEAAAQRLHRRRLRGPTLRARRLRAARGHAHQDAVLPVPPRVSADARRQHPRRPTSAAGGTGGGGRQAARRGRGGGAGAG